MGGLADERYSHKGLETVLDEFFGNEPLGAGLTHTLITSYDIQNRQPVFLENPRGSPIRADEARGKGHVRGTHLF